MKGAPPIRGEAKLEIDVERTILVVDDDKEQAKFLKTLLEAKGYSVHQAPNAQFAASLIHKNMGDIVGARRLPHAGDERRRGHADLSKNRPRSSGHHDIRRCLGRGA